MAIFLVMWQFSAVAIVTESMDLCRDLQSLNQVYWASIGMAPPSLCAPSWEI